MFKKSISVLIKILFHTLTFYKYFFMKIQSIKNAKSQVQIHTRPHLVIQENYLCDISLYLTCVSLKIEPYSINDHFTTISSPFMADYTYIFHKNQVQMVILKCLTCLNLDWIKGYNMKHNKVISFFFFCNFIKKKYENLQLKKGHFMTLSGHFFANYTKSFKKLKFKRSF